MKKTLIVSALAVLTSISAFGQGAVVFANNAATAVRIDNATTGAAVPTGSAYTAELMFAPDGTPTSEFDSLAVRVGATTTFNTPSAGQYNAGGRTALGVVPPGGWGLFQVRVWQTAYGNSYSAAVANPAAVNTARAGTSAIMRVDTDDPADTNPATPLTGYLSPMAVTVIVPEPSAIALGLLGAGALLLLRRRK